MACCVCCCETKQNGTCCGSGPSAVCCPQGEYCCNGACQATPCNNTCCFVNTGGYYSFSFGAYSGSIASGVWFGGSGEYLVFSCTGVIDVCGVSQNPGLFIEFYDGTDAWQGSVDGNWDTHSCSSQQSLAGTYTLKNCTTSSTQSLTVT